MIDKKNLKKIKKSLPEKQSLEELLLIGLKSGDTTPLIKADFEDIKKRGLERVKNKVK